MKIPLTDLESQTLDQVVKFNSTETEVIELDFTHSNAYILYLIFNGLKVGFTNFGTAMAYLAGYQMHRKLIKHQS